MKTVRPSPFFDPAVLRRYRSSLSLLLPPAVDLLEGMLLLDPERRLTAKQGLSHPYLAEYHDLESEPDSDPYDDSFESLELAVGEWKSECTVRTFILTLSQRGIKAQVGWPSGSTGRVRTFGTLPSAGLLLYCHRSARPSQQLTGGR